MGDVIHVDFSKKNEVEDTYIITSDLADYLNSLRGMGVEEDDILETLDAINDMNAYFAADDEVKQFANGWLEQFL